MEEEPSGGSKRKAPSCSRCSNHGKTAPLTHHKCPFEECDCLLCKLTQVRKLIMRIQQQRWRLRKQNEKWEEGAEGGEGEEGGGKQKQKYCDMCRNHGVFEKNRGHKRSCKYENCPCEFCSFTRKRRQIMQLQQKVKRSNITNQQLQEANEWVTKLTAELANVRIDDVSDISNLATPMSSSSNLPTHHGTFPPSSTAEGQFPSSITAGLFQPSLQIETFPIQPSSSSSSSHMTRPFMPGASAVEQHPSTSFHMDPNSCGVIAGASSFPSSSNVIHVPMASASSYPSFCPPSPSYSSPSASPISDYDASSYPSCPSPLLSYLCSDNTNREMMMTSHLQQTCAAIKNITPSVEPIDCSEHLKHSCRSHKHAENRHHEPTESHSVHPNRSLHSIHQSNAPCWSGEQRDTDEVSPDKYWEGQRRNSDGVIQQCYKQSQRRNSDSVIQGIYRPSQRRNSDSVIKKLFGQTQRGNSGVVIQESFVPEERGNNEEVEQEHYKADLRDSTEDVVEQCHGAEERVRGLHQLDQRRNSDGIPLMTHRQNERRHSDGVLRKCFVLNPRGNYDRIVQKYVPHPPEGSTEVIYSNYRHSERRSSDETSQGSCGMDQRRNSIDSIQENFRSTERRDSDEVSKSYYWPWQRSDSGEIVHENNWPNQRRDSDELIQRNYQLNKEHFFENNLRREHEALERLDRARPMSDMSVNIPSEQRSYYKDHLPMENPYHQATGIVEGTNVARGDDDVEPQHSMMSWDDHPQEEANLHSETLAEQNYEEMEGPLDLTVRSTTKR